MRRAAKAYACRNVPRLPIFRGSSKQPFSLWSRNVNHRVGKFVGMLTTVVSTSGTNDRVFGCSYRGTYRSHKSYLVHADPGFPQALKLAAGGNETPQPASRCSGRCSNLPVLLRVNVA
jgi:hypothetical protein